MYTIKTDRSAIQEPQNRLNDLLERSSCAQYPHSLIHPYSQTPPPSPPPHATPLLSLSPSPPHPPPSSSYPAGSPSSCPPSCPSPTIPATRLSRALRAGSARLRLERRLLGRRGGLCICGRLGWRKRRKGREERKGKGGRRTWRLCSGKLGLRWWLGPWFT